MTTPSWKISAGQIDALNAIFIAAPREMSPRRFAEIVKHYLPKAHIVLGISKESYVAGYEDLPQFTMLELATVEPVIAKVAQAVTPHKVWVYEYAQADVAKVLNEHTFKRVLLVNGSWKYAFHNLEAYEVLMRREIPFKFISPFASEAEAHDYEATHQPVIELPEAGAVLSERDMARVTERVADYSFDNSFHTGASLGRKVEGGYAYITAAFNQVIPYQAYALHHGNSREKHMSRPHDTNHYDTIHAEMQLLTKALAEQIDLAGATLFVNLLPCPNCARTLSQTGVVELVYRHDHSEGYAAKLFEMCGKKVRQLHGSS